MISKTAQYALRALVYLSRQRGDRLVLAKEIAEKTGVPHFYLSRILREAVRVGLLESSRGVGGGFRLSRARRDVPLFDVLAPYDDVVGRARCPFGQPRCSDERPCGFHPYWKPIATAYRRMLEGTTLADVTTRGLVAKPARPARKR